MHPAEKVLGPFIENAPFALAMFDREMRYLCVSRGWRKDYGLDDRDVRGLSQYELFPEIPDRWREFHRRGLIGETLEEDEDRFERADGSVQWVRWQIRPWYEANGKLGGIIISAEEITSRKRAEEQHRVSDELYRGLVQATSDIVWRGQVVGGYVDISAWSSFTGQTEEQARQGWLECVHPEDRGKVAVAWQNFIRNGGAYKQAYRLRGSDGEFRWMGVTDVSLREKDGSIRLAMLRNG